MKIDSHEMLHDRDFGSALLDVAHLSEWLAGKRLRLPITLDADFIQIEKLLAKIQHATQESVTRAEALAIVEADHALSKHEMARLSPQWLLGGEAYVQWKVLIGEAQERGELVFLDFSSKLPLTKKSGRAEIPMQTKPDETHDDDAKFAQLFDAVTVEVLAVMFPTQKTSQWKSWAEKASTNGLIDAREARAMFNPYRAAMWFKDQRGVGWTIERCHRELAKHLPARSRDKEHMLIGYLDD